MQVNTHPHVLVADDHAMMRDGIVLMIQTTWPDSTCEVAHDYQGVMTQLEGQLDGLPFDVVVLDLRMPGMRGVESVAQITQRAAGTPVIVCTALEDPSLVERLMSSGIFCAVNKTTGADELLKHVRDALQIHRIPGKASQIDAMPRLHNTTNLGGSAMLTTRQREILKMLHTGKPSKVIAAQLGIGLGTIKSHLHTLYSVMEVNSRSEAIVKSLNWLL